MKQRYTPWPWNRPGFDRVIRAHVLIRVPPAELGTSLLELLTAVAPATLEPQPVQRVLEDPLAVLEQEECRRANNQGVADKNGADRLGYVAPEADWLRKPRLRGSR